MDLVVQGQRVIALAPIVTDALFLVDDQRIELQLLAPRCDRKPGLSAADDENDWIAIGVAALSLALIQPVGSAKVARIGLAPWSRRSELFFESLQFVECGQKGPGLELVPIGLIADQPQNSAAATERRFKFENR